jgi:exonuclease III
VLALGSSRTARPEAATRRLPTPVFRRIDDQIATPGLAARATRRASWEQTRSSDHAPLVINYAFPR